MGCDVSGEQLWSWIDRDAPELEEHLAACPACRAKAAGIREEIGLLAGDASAEIPVPEKIGPYAIRRLIGEGGQALVYEAEQPSPQRPVALKLLKGGQLVDKNRLRHFRREIQSLARLNHPAIATIYEAGRTPDGLHYFAMELVNGVPLHTYVKERKPARIDRLRLFLKVCGAVQYAHDQGVVHRDLKPSNIMVNPEGEPKILDFGLARVTQSDTAMSLTLSREGRVEGTPRYMSPEQIRGAQDQIDHRTDVYALGVILYELMTGAPPKAITTVSPATIRTLCEETPPVPSSIDSSLRGELDAVVMKALENERDDRYASAKDLAEDVSRYLEGKPVAAKRARTFYIMRKIWPRRASRSVVGLAAAGLVAALAYSTWNARQSPYDPLPDRMVLLKIRCDLLRDDPSQSTFQNADEAPFRYPRLPEAVLVRVQAFHLSRRHSEAAATLMLAIASDPSQWAYGHLQEEIESRQKPTVERRGASTYWNDTLARSADAWYVRSFAALNVDSALAWAKEATAREPRHRLALAATARLSEIKGDVESVLAATEELVRAGYDADSWLRYRAAYLVGLGQFDDAMVEGDRVVAGSGGRSTGYALRAKIARRMGRYAEAERDYSAAIRAGGQTRYETGWLFFHRGSLRWLLGREEDAAADYKAAYEHLGYPTFANARLFIVLHDMGRTAEADAALADARRANVDDVWLGRIFESLGGSSTPESLAAFADSTGDPVTICEGYYYAGEAARLAGQIDEAHRWFEKCVGTGVECDPADILESQSEFQLARMRLSQFAETADTSDRE